MRSRISWSSLFVLFVLLVPHAALAAAPPSVVDKVAVLEAAVASQQAQLATTNADIATLQGQVADLQDKLKFVSVVTGPINGLAGPHLIFAGVNVHIRSGSHNLIIGEFHSFSSFGGLVVNFANTISGPYASVSGGNANTASGGAASVLGGNGNTASAIDQHIS